MSGKLPIKLIVILSIFLVTGLIAFSLYGKKVEVFPAYVGMILTENGFEDNLIQPSRFRLDTCISYCDSLILVEVSDQGKEESFTLFMPKDSLNMTFDVRFTMSVRNEDNAIKMILDRIPSTVLDNDERIRQVTADRVYDVYGQPIIREIVRAVIANYTINEVASNRDIVNAAISQAVNDALADTPLIARRIALADVQYPSVITTAQEEAAERQIAIDRERNEQQVMMVQMETQLEQARQERAIRIERANAVLEENNIIAQSVTPSYLAYRQLEVLEAMANNNNTIFVPMEALGTIGLQNAIYSILNNVANDNIQDNLDQQAIGE